MIEGPPGGREAWDPQLTNLLGAITVAISDRVRAATEQVAGLGAAGPAALVALAELADGAPIERLRGVLGLTHSGCVRLVDRLADAGLVRRVAGPDRRAVSIVLTKPGRVAARRVRDARAAAIDPLLAGLTAGERRRLHALAITLAAAITRQRLEDRADGRAVEGGWLCRLCDFTACGRNEGRCPAANLAAQSARTAR